MKRYVVFLLAVLMLVPNVSFAERLTSYETGQPIVVQGKEVMLKDNLGLSSLGFRGVWVNTVWNNDFPKKAGMSEAEYKREYIQMLDKFQKYYVNAVIFQVRPSGDAFYFSNLNPISQFLTGTEGQGATWDPLAFMIEEAHKRGMEFHAWFNPYRVTHKDYEGGKEEILSKLSEQNWARNNPNSVFQAGKKLYLKPWDEKARDFIKDTVMEVVKKYDIDAVHFDDYFYPSKNLINSNGFYNEESEAYSSKAKGANVEYWRRSQTDALIQYIKTSIQSYNRVNGDNVQFGISPVGIWGTLEKHGPNSYEGAGVNIFGGAYSSFDNQFADTRKWVKEGWIDYIVPQVYWTFQQERSPYGEIVAWWADVVKGTNVKLYIGHANYKLNSKDKKEIAWTNPREIFNQLKFNDLYKDISGSVFFNATTLYDDANFSNENRRFLEVLSSELASSFEAQSQTSTGIKPKEELNVDESVKIDYAVRKTKYGNLVHWVDNYSGVSSHYVIYRVTNSAGVESKIPLSMVQKLSKTYFYIDKGFNGNAEYRIEAVR